MNTVKFIIVEQKKELSEYSIVKQIEVTLRLLKPYVTLILEYLVFKLKEIGKHFVYTISPLIRFGFFIVIVGISNTVSSMNDSKIINQGEVYLSFEDIDGFSYTMPEDIRNGFFNDLDRLDSTLVNLLAMKHVVNNAKLNNLINVKDVGLNVTKHLHEKSEKIQQLNLSDFQYLQLKKYLKLKYSYIYLQEEMRKSINKESFEDFAHEKYIVTKEKYHNKPKRDVRYIEIKFNNKNKNEQKLIAGNILKSFENSNENFESLLKQYEEDKTINFISGINDFHHNDKYVEFSNYIFKPNNLGVINQMLSLEDRYIIVDILKIQPDYYTKFEDVKSSIINQLVDNKAKLKFNEMISELTQDTIEVNKEAIVSLTTRYSQKIKK